VAEDSQEGMIAGAARGPESPGAGAVNRGTEVQPNSRRRQPRPRWFKVGEEEGNRQSAAVDLRHHTPCDRTSDYVERRLEGPFRRSSSATLVNECSDRLPRHPQRG